MLEKVFQGPPPSASVPSRGEPEVSSSLVGQADAAPRAIGSEAEAGERVLTSLSGSNKLQRLRNINRNTGSSIYKYKALVAQAVLVRGRRSHLKYQKRNAVAFMHHILRGRARRRQERGGIPSSSSKTNGLRTD